MEAEEGKKATAAVTGKRLTVCYEGKDEEGKTVTKRKAILCPGNWDDFIGVCAGLLGETPSRVELSDELGGGEIDSLDLLAKGDTVFIYPPGRTTKKKKKKKKTPKRKKKKAKSRSDSTNTPPTSGSSSGFGSYGSGPSSFTASWHCHSTPSSWLGAISFREDPTQYQKLYKLVRSLNFRSFYFYTMTSPNANNLKKTLHNLSAETFNKPAPPSTTLSVGKAYQLGEFCANHESVVAEYTKTLKMDLPAKERKKLKKDYINTLTRSQGQSGLLALEEMIEFCPVNVIGISCGQNMTAVVTEPKDDSLTGNILMKGSGQIHPICLGSKTALKNNQSLQASPISYQKSGFLMVDCGPLHTAAITDQNTVVTWGYNMNCSLLGLKGPENLKKMSQVNDSTFEVSGQLGLGKSDVYFSPPTVVKGITGEIISVSCGSAHTMVLTTTGVWSFGLNDEGALGHQGNHLVPTLIKSLSSKVILKVSAGGHHSAAVDNNGTLYTWGWNEAGQLGLKTSRNTVFDPTVVDALSGEWVKDVACGDTHTACSTDRGKLFTWGKNDYGQLGRRGKKNSAPAEVDLKNLYIVGVSCGPDNTAVVTAEGLALITGKLCGKGLSSHQNTFRVLDEVLVKNIFVSKIHCGITHFAILDDYQLSNVLDVFVRACSFKNFTTEEIEECINTTPPFFLQKIQYRALRAVVRANTVDPPPSISVKTGFLEFLTGSVCEEITIKNNSKYKVLISPSTSNTKLTSGLSLKFNPPELKIKQGKLATLQVEICGTPSDDCFSFLTLVAQPSKGRQSIQCFVMIVIHGPKMSAGDTNSIEKYAKTKLPTQPSQQTSSSSPINFGSMIDFATAEISLYERLGSGGSGAVVYRCTANGFTCAVKILDVSTQIRETIDSFLNEIKLIESLDHKRIVKYLGHDVTMGKIRLFMAYYPWSLSSILKKRRGRLLPMKECVTIAYQISEGLLFLHSHNPPIIHRDLKPGNVLVALDALDQIKTCKITDFDVSRTLQDNEEAMTLAGTPQYCAPEVMCAEFQGYSGKADIWSFGQLIYEVLTLKPPYHGAEPRSVSRLVEKGVKPTIPDNLFGSDNSREPLIKLLVECTELKPENRPSTSALFKRCYALAVQYSVADS